MYALSKIDLFKHEHKSEIEKKYFLSGDLTRKKLFSFLPALILTNISTALLISVDSLVAGNMISADALASISFYSPVSNIIGAITAIISTGSATLLSLRVGDVDSDGILRTKKLIANISVIAAIIVSLLQIPIVFFIINTYDLSPEMISMMKSYAIGMMIATPFGMISTIGTYQLQVMGKMRVLMALAIIEGLTNLGLNVFFVGVLDLGVAGTGFGTACANIVRCACTLIYLFKKTDMYSFRDAHWTKSDLKELIKKGLPDASSIFINATITYVMAHIIILYFGQDGGVIKGVLSFLYSIVFVISSSIQGSTRPLVGLLNGIKDRRGIIVLIHQGVNLSLIFVGLLSLIFCLFPEWFYSIQGVKDIPEGGILSVRFYAFYFVFTTIDSLFRMYFASAGNPRFSTILTLAGNALVPGVAYLLGKFFAPPYIWLAYLIVESLILIVNLIRYLRMALIEKKRETDSEDAIYLSVKPEEAYEAATMVQEYAIDMGYSEKIAKRARLCMEEMVAYSVKASKAIRVRNQIVFHFSDKGIRFMMLDDGECIPFNNDEEETSYMIDNYKLLKRLSKKLKYQYVLDMNYTLLQF